MIEEMSIINKISIDEIPDESFEGYYWLSDASHPEEVKDGKALKDILLEIKDALPFIVEANLYNADEQKGISIRHVNGEYFISLIDLSSLDASQYSIVEKSFKSILGPGDFKMLEIWKTENDPLMEDVSVNKPYLSVFAGFEK